VLGAEHLRAYAVPLADGAGPAAGGAVIVAVTTRGDERTIHALRPVVLAAALLAALIAAGAAMLLTRRALRPLAELSTAAAEISRTGDAARRLPRPHSADELDALADTLNGMLASLERARDAERRFVGDASHELRTPLTAIRGNVEHLARHGATPELIADLSADATRLSHLLDELVALAREDAAGRPQTPVRLDELIADAAAANDRVAVEAGDAVTVRGDREALRRALTNLIRNAELYGPRDGRIHVAARRLNGSALLVVEDEGEGLAPADAERAFERFWRGRGAPDAPGSGLGLAIVRATAERHGGEARIDGSRVTIELPAIDPTAAA